MNRIKSYFLAAATAVSLLTLAESNAAEDVIAVFQPTFVADRHSDSRSSWNQRQSSNRDRGYAQPYLRNNPDQGYYYWNQKYFAGKPNLQDRPYYYYYYDPKYYYDDNNGSVKYVPNY